ncbi:non-specific lipid transfer protein GPI-anchored 16-like [Diospyros lotus]|uniref:non-specific lipid transfer protein GPI-anchored 16-like n=1 Tax=Diospyros lotus TaxID=55363 RepID=UPI00225AA6CF|nr:non-specific lipid transfer protein GPI-anchored 16-like [Diospyros lotus]
MEPFEPFRSLIAVTASVLVILSVVCVEGQISTPCTSSIIGSFTPCMNFITGSTSNGSSPTSDCCNIFKSLMTDSMDCACLVVTGNVPFPLPINRTLALSLSRSCNISLPVQCKASGVPLPAPGPVLFGPTISPAADSPSSPRVSKAVGAGAGPAAAVAPSPLGTTDLPIAPASPPVTTEAAGIRPVKTPASAANPPRIPSPYILSLMFMGILGLS